MRRYPSYRLEDFFRKSYLEGGMTYNQFLFLFETAEEERYNHDRFLASIHGIDLENTEAEVIDSTAGPVIRKNVNKQSSPMMFGDPTEYEKLTDEERTELTAKMKGHFTPFVNTTMKASKPVLHPS